VDAMEKTRLGRSNLQVSRIAFGTWQLGGDWGATDEAAAVAAIREAADQGINFFDTAQGYGFGASEQLLARALTGRRREEVVIATKGGLDQLEMGASKGMQVRHGAGQIHYFIGGGGGFGSGSGSTGGEIVTWVNQHFAAVTVDGVTIYDLTAPSS
jgi:Aldo/keto reductase family